MSRTIVPSLDALRGMMVVRRRESAYLAAHCLNTHKYAPKLVSEMIEAHQAIAALDAVITEGKESMNARAGSGGF